MPPKKTKIKSTPKVKAKATAKAKTTAKPKAVAKKSVAKKPAKVEPRKVTAEIVLDDDAALRNPPAVAEPRALVSSDPVTSYLAEIKKYPLLSKAKEHELAVRYFNTKDPAIAQILVTSNLRFVVKIAAEYSKFGARLIDLIQEGNVGLMRAVREFNPYKGTRLITYAVWWIRGYIREYLLKHYSMVKIGTTQNQKKLFYNLMKEKELMEAEGLTPNVKMISTRLGVREKDVELMQERLGAKDVSLDAPLDGESQSRLLDFQSNPDELSIDDQLSLLEQLELLRQNIDKIRPSLTEKELYLLENRMLADNPMTLQEVGDHYGITREAVRQSEARLLDKIKAVFLEAANRRPEENN